MSFKNKLRLLILPTIFVSVIIILVINFYVPSFQMRNMQYELMENRIEYIIDICNVGFSEIEALGMDTVNFYNDATKRKVLEQIEGLFIESDNIVIIDITTGDFVFSLNPEEDNYLISKELLREIRNELQLESDNSVETNLLNIKKKLGIYGFYDNWDWLIIETVNDSYVYRYILDAILYSVVATVLFFIIVFIVIYRFSYNISNNLEELGKGTIQISEGDFNLNINVKSKDEFGKLADNFNIMASEIKNRQAEIVNQKERLAVTLRSIGDGVITTDISGNITMINNEAENLTGWKSQEAIGQPLVTVFNIVNKITSEQLENPVKKVLETGQIMEIDNNPCLINKAGNECIITNSIAPIRDSHSNIFGAVLVFRDMSEKIKLEESIQREQKLESLGILAGGIAHDFNNLLGGIFGYIELANLVIQDEKVSGYLSKAMSTVDRAQALTGQLLTFAKGGAPTKTIGSLFPYIEETALFALSGSSSSIDFDIQDKLWPCAFDKNQIGQVIDNLIINAQQAMPKGGAIHLSAQNIALKEWDHSVLTAGNYVRLSIKDQGIGIPKELLIRIFDPFYTTKETGNGLGLATCYSIANRHGGCIDVESEQGNGSTFSIFLPASKGVTVQSQIEIIIEHKGQGVFLVMDDEEVMGETIRDMLESFGYKVILKQNGEDAVKYITSELKENRKIVGVIFDLTIPGGMGGKEAVLEVRRLSKKIPVFVSSGYASDPIMANPNDYGFTASISKPFRINELMQMLNTYL